MGYVVRHINRKQLCPSFTYTARTERKSRQRRGGYNYWVVVPHRTKNDAGEKRYGLALIFEYWGSAWHITRHFRSYQGAAA